MNVLTTKKRKKKNLESFYESMSVNFRRVGMEFEPQNENLIIEFLLASEWDVRFGEMFGFIFSSRGEKIL